MLTIRLERAESVLGLGAIYRKVKEYRQRIEAGQYRYQQAIHHLEIHSNYRVRIVAYDSHHCEGQVAETYINSK